MTHAGRPMGRRGANLRVAAETRASGAGEWGRRRLQSQPATRPHRGSGFEAPSWEETASDSFTQTSFKFFPECPVPSGDRLEGPAQEELSEGPGIRGRLQEAFGGIVSSTGSVVSSATSSPVRVASNIRGFLSSKLGSSFGDTGEDRPENIFCSMLYFKS